MDRFVVFVFIYSAAANCLLALRLPTEAGSTNGMAPQTSVVDINVIEKAVADALQKQAAQPAVPSAVRVTPEATPGSSQTAAAQGGNQTAATNSSQGMSMPLAHAQLLFIGTLNGSGSVVVCLTRDKVYEHVICTNKHFESSLLKSSGKVHLIFLLWP